MESQQQYQLETERLMAAKDAREARKEQFVELLQALSAQLVTEDEARAYTQRIRPEWYSDE